VSKQPPASAAVELFPDGTLAKLATVTHALQGARDLLNGGADDDGAKDGAQAIIELVMEELERISAEQETFAEASHRL
jgi:hypothetical protein